MALYRFFAQLKVGSLVVTLAGWMDFIRVWKGSDKGRLSLAQISTLWHNMQLKSEFIPS